jgi:hypothetical protein
VQIQLSRGLAHHGMTALHDACCMHHARLQLAFLSQYFPIRVPPLDSHVPTISPRVSYLARLHAWRCFVLPNPHTSPRLRKSGSRQLPGNNHQSTCQESPVKFATARFSHRIQSQMSKTGLCISVVLPFSGSQRGRLSTWGPNLFSLVDRSPSPLSSKLSRNR